MSGCEIRSIAIVGGGIAAWSAAVAFAKRLPHLAISVLDTGVARDSVIDRIAPMLPSAREFHEQAGIPEIALIRQLGASYRLGSLMAGWAGEAPPYIHCYDPYGEPVGQVPFRHIWSRMRHEGQAPPFDSFSAAAAMARAGRFDADEAEALGTDYGLSIAPDSYRAWLKGYAQHLGVPVVEATIAGLRTDPASGHIAAVQCGDGRVVEADLFVDATGPARLLHRSQSAWFESWSRWLFVDRLLVAHGPSLGPPALIEQVVAHPAGWHWSGASLVGTHHGFAYASSALDDAAAQRQIEAATGAQAEPAARIAQGRVSEPWAGNCVAIGDTAVGLEPLQFAGLHLVHCAIDRIIGKLPARDFAAVELADYNRETIGEIDRVRDFVIAHYAAARRPADPHWAAAAAAELPPSLAHTLSLFAERGRLPTYEEESFAPDSWAAVLIGQGMIPRRLNALVRTLDLKEVDSGLRALHEAITRRVAGLPPLVATMRHLLEKNAA